MLYRIGIGYDIHRLVEGRKLFLGCVEIPYAKGLLGHSDADCLVHAICDALLGAASLGDIGEHFPDSDPNYLDISGKKLLEKVYTLITKKGFRVRNVDSVIIAQEPALVNFKKEMQGEISKILKIKEEDIGIKAKTNDTLGEIGNKEAIASYAVVLITRGA